MAAGSVEATLELWASSLREVKGRIRPLFQRERMAACLRVLASMLRDVGVLVEGGDARVLANPDSRNELETVARSFDSDRTTGAFRAVDEALTALERNVSPKVVAGWLALQL